MSKDQIAYSLNCNILKMAISGGQGKQSLCPAEATPAAPTTHKTCFTKGRASPLNQGALQKHQTDQNLKICQYFS